MQLPSLDRVAPKILDAVYFFQMYFIFFALLSVLVLIITLFLSVMVSILNSDALSICYVLQFAAVACHLIKCSLQN